MQGKRIAVTGGAGFIGSHLVSALSVENSVTVIDDLSTGKLENLGNISCNGNVSFIKGNITDAVMLRKSFANMDYIFHAAAITSVPRSIEEPIKSNEINIQGTLNVLQAARENGITKLIFSSSSAIYGSSPVLPKRENMLPEVVSPYAVEKVTGEYYCKVYNNVYGLDTICLRYFNVYGPRQDPDSFYAAVIPLFIRSVYERKPISIFDDGTQTRDFVFVKDVVRANIQAAESDRCGVYNIGSGKQTSINELAIDIQDIMNVNVETVYLKPRAGDVKHSVADISKACQIGYHPQYSWKKGLKETISWYIDST